MQKACKAAQTIEACGYETNELRIVYSDGLENVLKEEKGKSDVVFLLTDKRCFDVVKPLIQSIYKTESYKSDNFIIYTEQTKTLCLLTTDIDVMQTEVAPYLQQKTSVRLGKLVIRSIGASLARVESLIAESKRRDGGRMRYRHRREYDEDVIEIFYGEDAPKMLLDDVLRLFAEGLADTVYALDDTPLAKQVVELLKIRGKKLSVAESFTGGGIAKKITEIAGASAVYFEGLNTYNELSKIRRLGVSEYTLHTYGAVSDQTAYEMAAGLIAEGTCDISIATTGLAGPKSDRSQLPVGLCYIAVGTKERVFVYRYKFDGDREEITQKAIHYALFLAYKQLKNI
jgi:nicotinamide-nucleotide amidase